MTKPKDDTPPAAPAAPAAPAPEQPREGGSYIRQPDGSLKRKDN